ncbi:MAG: hypothetical protein ACLQVD_17600 [Capsulimonadaceae bacterium]
MRSKFWIATAAALSAASTAGMAANPLSKTVGPINYRAAKMIMVWAKDRHEADLIQGFEIRSETYHLSGDQAVMTFSPTGPASDFTKIVATGKEGAQVRAEFLDNVESEWLVLKSDQVVIVPDSTVPNGRIATFSGHVKITASSAQELAQPSDTTVDGAIVYLGTAPDRPRLEATGVNGSAVPLAGGQQ